MSARIYPRILPTLMSGKLNLNTAQVWVALFTAGYVPDMVSDEFFDQLTGEVWGPGYQRGGQPLSLGEARWDHRRLVFDAPPCVWTGASFEAAYAVTYLATGHLLSVTDLPRNPVQVGDFTLTWPEQGAFFAEAAA